MKKAIWAVKQLGMFIVPCVGMLAAGALLAKAVLP
jgi:hypothetical protein